MKLIIVIFLMTFLDQVVSYTPYCEFDYTEISDERETFPLYTCNVVIDGKITVFNELYTTHEQDSPHSNKDVAVLSFANKAKLWIDIFTSIYCDKLKRLRFIYVNEIEIMTVNSDSLNNCEELLLLTFYRNEIEIINEDLLTNNPNLTEVNLIYNKIKSLPEKLFVKQKKLKILKLSGNSIKSLPDGIFESQQLLQVLMLDVNNFKVLNPNWFKRMHNLRELDLSENKIEDLEENVFNPLERLEILKLHSNNLAFIRSNSFDRHPRLREITLHKNQIFGIDEQFINKIPIKKLTMKKNTCSNDESIARHEMSVKLQSCFENYLLQKHDIEIETTTPKTTRPPRTPRTTTTSTTTTQSTTESTTTTRTSTTQATTTTTTESSSSKTACGIPNNGQALIVRGENFAPGSYPWMAVLINQNDEVHCGGVLISDRKVLTAGHCIIDKSKKVYTKDDLIVVLGGHNLTALHEINRISVEIETIEVHKNWNPTRTKFDSDIAVVVLMDEIYPELKIAPICLTYPYSPALMVQIGTVIGYGKTGKLSKYSEMPKQAEAPIHKSHYCFNKYKAIRPIASTTTFCGGHGNGTGACTGDSGNGLFVAYNNVYYLLGLVSSSLTHTVLGCNVNAYSLYTNVTMFIQWIESIEPNPISTRGYFIKPWSPKKPIHSLYGDLPVWS
ncbi:uncharacterized protein [Chironomus tepperi]|uniref:uncharacterized protein n=1 Tax=Chironomus tepperi TaxID=113505 RepID=UPI00391F4A44